MSELRPSDFHGMLARVVESDDHIIHDEDLAAFGDRDEVLTVPFVGRASPDQSHARLTHSIPLPANRCHERFLKPCTSSSVQRLSSSKWLRLRPQREPSRNAVVQKNGPCEQVSTEKHVNFVAWQRRGEESTLVLKGARDDDPGMDARKAVAPRRRLDSPRADARKAQRFGDLSANDRSRGAGVNHRRSVRLPRVDSRDEVETPGRFNPDQKPGAQRFQRLDLKAQDSHSSWKDTTQLEKDLMLEDLLDEEWAFRETSVPGLQCFHLRVVDA